MKTLFCVLAAALSIAPIVCSAAPADSGNPRAAIQAAYDQQNTAAETKNVDLFMKSYSPDFKAIDHDGAPISRQQAKKNMVTLFAAATHLSGQTTITAFTIKAGKAYVTTQEHDEVVAPDPSTQTPVTMVDDEVDSDTWTKVNGVWLEQFSRVVSEHTSVHQGTPLDSKPGQSA